MRTVTLSLPYYKQGDDLYHYLKKTESKEDALELHAQFMDVAAKQLRAVKEVVAGKNVEFEADTHMIIITGDDKVLDELIRLELVQDDIDDFYEDEWDEEE
jgi:hypothetical protein